MHVVLPDSKDFDGPKIIARNLDSVSKTFDGSTKRIEQATHLASYLYAIDENAYAEQLLRSVVSTPTYERDESRWSAIGYGITLLSELLFAAGRGSDAEEAMRSLSETDIYFGAVNREKIVEQCLEDIRNEIDVVRGETQKFACEMLASRLLELTYFSQADKYLSVEKLKKSTMEQIADDTKSLIERLRVRLIEG